MSEEIVSAEELRETPGERQARLNAERREELRRQAEEELKQFKESMEAVREGKGKLRLEKPIQAGDREITELEYDFTALSGLDYTEAMDVGQNASQNPASISYRQGLSLFAKAAAMQNERLDMKDIVSRIGMTDAVAAVEAASSFFTGSVRAGLKRISKRS